MFDDGDRPIDRDLGVVFVVYVELLLVFTHIYSYRIKINEANHILHVP